MKINAEMRGGCLRLAMNGELDHHAAAETLRLIERELDRCLPENCALDLSGVSFMDSSGIAVILRTYKRMSETDGKLCVIDAHGQAGKVIAASGIERLLPVLFREEKMAQ